ncbi:nicotinamide mononucleotide transporter [Thermobifida halotolerans]|uniref:Nicotinamide mononucleotide transporter n=1 Tax=Thermobifida halotolerans TaxID=483545 RepID=A0A399G618_9ACTN|nr:nicotinamide riboside transporter PnuC [Thermobifida halotolerans]UOE20195.1 nicotinamide mononucleotide transporter [Thermobifida halotolerans]
MSGSGAAWLEWAHAGFTLFGEHVRWADLLGNVAALATVALAIRRTIWTWPVQLTGTVLLFAVSVDAQIVGNALKQVIIAALAGYGWYRWARGMRGDADLPVRPATGAERLRLVGALVAGTAAVGWFFAFTGWSWAPWLDAFIFVGSAVAMYAQSRGLVDFWVVWIVVDMVGIPITLMSGLWVSGIVYGIFFALAVVGFRDWMRHYRSRQERGAHAAPVSA